MICRTCKLDKPLRAYQLDANQRRKSPDCKLCVSSLTAKKRGAKQANSKARKNPERGREWFRVVME